MWVNEAQRGDAVSNTYTGSLLGTSGGAGSGRGPARRRERRLQRRKRGGVHLIRQSGCAACSSRRLRRARSCTVGNGSGGAAENVTLRESRIGYFQLNS